MKVLSLISFSRHRFFTDSGSTAASTSMPSGVKVRCDLRSCGNAEIENMMGSRWQDAETQNGSQANPGGRPKCEIEIREMARAHGPQCMSRAVDREEYVTVL